MFTLREDLSAAILAMAVASFTDIPRRQCPRERATDQ